MCPVVSLAAPFVAHTATQVTGAVNIITVTILPNVDLVSPAVLVVTGCVSQTVDSQTLALAGKDATLFTRQAASWSQRQMTLQVLTPKP